MQAGDERAATGSHYTPDDLVQPLIKHSLDHLIAERLKTPNPEGALLDLRIADIACGSGHILLAAARRIATDLAITRTGEEQPSPSAYRTALRDVIPASRSTSSTTTLNVAMPSSASSTGRI